MTVVLIVTKSPAAEPRQPRPRGPRKLALSVALVVGGLLLTAATQPALGRDLGDRRDEVQRQLQRSEAHLDQSSARLVDAVAGLESAQSELAATRMRLAQTRGELAAAHAFDDQMQDELVSAVQDLRRARQELARGRARMAAQEKLLAKIVVHNYETGDPSLLALSMVLNSQDTAELTSQLNSVRSVLDKEAATLDGLEASRVLLTMREEEFQDAQREVARRRAAAAENLERKKALEAEAVTAHARIGELVVERSRARDEAAEARAQDLREIQDLESERQRISTLLAQRAAAARAKAEEARRQAEARAQAAAEAAAQARESARQERSRKRKPSRSTQSAPRPPAPAPAGCPTSTARTSQQRA